MEKKLQAGFARMDISPRTLSVPLAGLGATHLGFGAEATDPDLLSRAAVMLEDQAIVHVEVEKGGNDPRQYRADHVRPGAETLSQQQLEEIEQSDIQQERAAGGQRVFDQLPISLHLLPNLAFAMILKILHESLTAL